MKCNKKAFVTMLVSAILALALLLTGGILLSRMPHNSVVASAEGTTVTKIARSYTDDGWYYGDSAGNLVKLSEEGEKLAETVITEGQGIRSVASDPKLDGLLVLDEAYDLFWVKDKGNSLEKQFIRAFPGGYLSLAVDDDFVYFAVPASRYTRTIKTIWRASPSRADKCTHASSRAQNIPFSPSFPERWWECTRTKTISLSSRARGSTTASQKIFL